MPSSLVLTVRFLDPEPAFHGRGDDGQPEWPPSPLRLYQALVAAAAARWKAGAFRDYAEPALRWLERQPPPAVVAPDTEPGHPFRTAVPNNDLDRVARAWSGGNYSNTGDANPATHRSLKTIQPTRLLGGNAVRYVYVLADADPDFERVRESLFAMTRAVTHVGWGVDVATMTAEVVAGDVTAGESEHAWRSGLSGGVPLRVPDVGTLDALVARHRDFLARAARPGVVDAGTPFTTFRVVSYHSPTAPTAPTSHATPTAPRAVAAFELRTTDFEQFQLYDTCTRTAAVAGMVRNATAKYADLTRPFGWTDARRLALIHGHTPDGKEQLRGDGADERFAFLPLPTIEARGRGEDYREVVGGVRRVLVVAPPGLPAAAQWAAGLAGHELDPLEGTRPAALRAIERPQADPVVRKYLEPARVWTTVTPVLRPGFDDRDRDKAEELMRKVFEHAGFAPELVKQSALEWRAVGFRAGVDHVCRFKVPKKLEEYPRFHVRVTWPVPVAGPVAVGAGRYRGFGVFVSEAGR